MLFQPKACCLALAVLLFTACTPADADYCRSYGVDPGNPEYTKCIQHFHKQEAWFSSDYSACALQADRLYPRTLYDNWDTAYVHRVDPRSGFVDVDTVSIPPDAYHNAQVDDLRLQIIAPCMDRVGWNSPDSWQTGRHPVKRARR